MLTFLRAQASVGLCRLVENDVGKVWLYFFSPNHVLKTELDCFLRVVLELYVSFVLVEVLLRAESTRNFFVSRFLPAAGFTVNRWTINYWFAKSYDPSLLAFTVYPYLSFAGGLGAWLSRMAQTLAPVTALRAFFAAPLPTTFFQQNFPRNYAFSRLMANFLAFVAAFQLCITNLATTLRSHFAVDICLQLFSTVAQSWDHLETWRAAALVTLQGAGMPAI